MKHEYIDDNLIVDRYLMDKLRPDEIDEFEQHYLHCTRCQDELALSEKLRQGIGQVAGDPLLETEEAAQGGLWRRYTRLAAKPAFATAASMLIVSAFAMNVASWRMLADSREEQTRLEDQLEVAWQPQINTPIVVLGAARSSTIQGGPAVRQLPLDGEPRWAILTMQQSPDVSILGYRASLRDANSKPIWWADDLLLDGNDEIVISVHSSIFSGGKYTLQIEGVNFDHEWITVGNYDLYVPPR